MIKSTLINPALSVLLLILCLTTQLSAQVPISDTLFLQALIDEGVDTNEDGLIQTDEALAVTVLSISGLDILNITGIEAFTNLVDLRISQTLIDSADLTSNTLLTAVDLSDNELVHVQLAGLSELRDLKLRNNDLTVLDLSSFTKLEILDLFDNEISSVNLSGLTQMIDLELSRNNLYDVDISDMPNLTRFSATDNQLVVIDFSTNPKLTNIRLSDNNITEIEVKHLKDLIVLVVTECPIQSLDIAGLDNLFTLWLNDSSVKTLFMKGCSPDPSQMKFIDVPLEFICADVSFFPQIWDELEDADNTDCQVTSLCPYTDEGIFSRISGSVKAAQSVADCDSSTNYLAYPKFYTTLLNITGQHDGVLIGTGAGAYSVNFRGTLTLEPAMTYAPAWQHVVPEFSASFSTGDTTQLIQDFCIVPVSDLVRTEVNLIPLQEFRAGFASDLVLTVHNTGTLPFSGTLTLHVPADSLIFVTADVDPLAVAAGTVSWAVNDLLPFQELRIHTAWQLNSPMDTPPLIGEETFRLCAELSGEGQEVVTTCVEDITVNSYDPNDKTYLGQDSVTVEQVAALDRLQYLIRFENTGSAEAVNIVITDQLDNVFLRPFTIQIEDASHAVDLELGEDGRAEFVFRDIYLPAEPGHNRGYVLFSVEARNTSIALGDSIKNNAAIYFDFNYPIITNEASLWVVDNTVATHALPTSTDPVVRLFPNPATETITIELATEPNRIEQVEWMDADGKWLKTEQVAATSYEFDTMNMAAGLYLLRITTSEAVVTRKVLVQK